MRAVCVRGRHFNGRQPSGLNIKIFRLQDESSSLGGAGVAYVGDKNTSARLCAKNARGGGGVFARHYGTYPEKITLSGGPQHHHVLGTTHSLGHVAFPL